MDNQDQIDELKIALNDKADEIEDLANWFQKKAYSSAAADFRVTHNMVAIHAQLENLACEVQEIIDSVRL